MLKLMGEKIFTFFNAQSKPLGMIRVSPLYIGKTCKQGLLQTVKTQMKCRTMWHFIRFYTVCYGKNRYPEKKNFLKIIP